MAEQIPFSIVEQLISALGSSALEEIKLAKGAKQELNKLKKTVTSIDAVLQDAEEQQHKDKLVQQWIRRLRDVFYEADDLIDEVATESLRQKVDAEGRTKGEVRNFFSFPKKLVPRVKMGHQIKKIREKLDEIARDMSQFNFLPHKAVVDRGVVNSTRETDSVPEGKIIGRAKSEEYIIELLRQPNQNSDNVSVVAIVGMGGLGKTTLAQMVYNDERVANYFSEKMWVCVSEVFNVKTLVKKMLQCLIGSDVGNLELEPLQRQLRDKLEGKRYLLVLDDVWNENKESWDQLRKHLCFGAQGSKILMTTRSKKVTKMVGVDSKTLYELEGLTNDESWNLFEQVAFRGDKERALSSRVLEVGKELVTERCEGVPLAIKTLASAMLSDPNEAYWRSIKENDQIWSPADNENEEDSILPVLKLSYYHLPNHLKQCFAYCSIFPKDTELPKQILIPMWLAQGYVQSSIGNKDLEEIAEIYFNDLLSRSFFQDAKQDDEFGEEVKMHDLIHDLAQMVSRNNCLISSLDKQNKIPEGVHHIQFDVKRIKPNEIISILNPIVKGKTKLRTLFFVDIDEEEETKSSIPDFVFTNFKCLRVLCFNSAIVELPSSIHKLKHLRFLVLGNCEFVKLPHTICDLLNLQSLFHFHCNYLEKLPKDLRKLVSLRHLIILDCGSLTSLPDCFHQLSSLQRLMICGCTQLSERCRKDDGPDWCKIQHIPNIRTDCEVIGRWS